MEFFNEAMLMLTGYHMFCYTKFVPLAATRYMVGISLIICTTFTIVVNLSMILMIPIKALKRKVYSIYLERRYKIHMEKLIKLR